MPTSDAIETYPFTAGDGATSELRVFRSARASSPVVLVMPALGTPALYYDAFAAALAATGLFVVVGENRGSGSSSVRASRSADFGYADVLALDWAPMIEAVRGLGGRRDLALVGHSIGGQLGALFEAEHPGTFRKLALVTSCSVDWRGWSGTRAYVVLGQTLVVGAVSRALGYFPGEHIGFGGRQGARFMRDWSRQARTGVYAPTGARVDHERALSGVRAELLSVSVQGDDYAPRAACDRLLAKMPSARATRTEIEASWSVRRPTDRHFRWAREPDAMIAAVAPFLEAS
jgi:predicted alpha/beta hydrolase